jgi:hypothetical protein
MKKYTTETRVYTENGYADAENCVDIEFYNQGNTVVNINGRDLQPNDWFSINGFPGEVNTGRYKITFVGGAGLMAVTRRVYKV